MIIDDIVALGLGYLMFIIGSIILLVGAVVSNLTVQSIGGVIVVVGTIIIGIFQNKN